MGAVALLDQARAAGLHVTVDGDKLIVRGPKRAATMVQTLAEHKAEIMALLMAPPPEPDADAPPAWSRRAELRAAGDPHWQAPAPYLDLTEFVEAPCRACKCKKTGAYQWAIGPDCAGCPERPQPKEARR